MQKVGIVPKELFDVSRLTSVLLTGSPVTPEQTAWFYENVKRDLWVTSPSGGTELCAGLVGGCTLLPVRAGEIQTRLLGMDVHAWNAAGEDVVDEVGELVVTSPAPSMPLRFMNDENDARYRETYFEHFRGVWRHGDFIKINARGGCYIYGRSDSTLNRHGVRLGSAEVYRAVERLPQISDSLVVCLELPGGAFFMPLFVRLADGAQLDDALRTQIVTTLRTDCSPRHVPDEIHAVPAIPYTLTGKKMEIPVRRILAGTPAEKSASREAMMHPEALDWYVRFRRDGQMAAGIGRRSRPQHVLVLLDEPIYRPSRAVYDIGREHLRLDFQRYFGGILMFLPAAFGIVATCPRLRSVRCVSVQRPAPGYAGGPSTNTPFTDCSGAGRRTFRIS